MFAKVISNQININSRRIYITSDETAQRHEPKYRKIKSLTANFR